MRKYFGTDGVRGIANIELTPELAFSLAKAGGQVLNSKDKENKNKKLALIGTDTRISKDMLKAALISGFTSAGFDCIDAGVITTPGIAYLSRYYNASIGAIISASHNPMEYNGIKFFDSEGFKLADVIEKEIESHLDDKNFGQIPRDDKIGRILDIDDTDEVYEKFLLESIKTDLTGYKIVLDTANGASYKIAPETFEKLGAHVVAIGNKPNGTNINDRCGSTDVTKLQKKVLEEGADFGLAFDGDADRLIAVDENGQVVDGDKIMLIIAKYLKEKNRLKNNKLVVTVMSNLGLFIAAKENGIDLEVTSVGDRYVLEKMLKDGDAIGGEQSGHVILLDYNTTGDGILTGLILSSIVKESGKKMSELAQIMEVYPQVLVNVNVKEEYKNGYKEIKEIMDKIEELEGLMKDHGRVLIRPSGTEPLLRIMLEGKDQEDIERLAEELAVIIREKCQ